MTAFGNQRPTFERVGEYAYTIGDEVADVFEEDGGATFFPSQRYELGLMLARRADGSAAASSLAISKPRQNGKSYAARYYAIYMALYEHKRVLYSAHNGGTSKKMFAQIAALFENAERFPEFCAEVKNVSHARGYEGIYFKDYKDADGVWHDGGAIEFSTRTNSGARGGTYSVIVIDEAQEMTAEHQEALLPTISAAADASRADLLPQQIYIGTPTPPASSGTVFRKMHDEAHGEKSGVWWLEWSVEGENIEALNLSAENVIQKAQDTNPALGYRIAERTVLDEFATMRPDGFARERLGWWSNSKKRFEPALNVEAFEACRSDDMKPEGKTAYAVKFSADGSEVILCGAVIPKNGAARISVIEQKPVGYGTRWLAEWLNARYNKASCVVIDGRNGVDVLVDRIADTWKMKGSIIKPSARDLIAAVSLLNDDINEKNITWYSKQLTLENSAKTSIKRPVAGGWAFGGENPLPIECCALALWGARTSKRDPNRKMRIG